MAALLGLYLVFVFQYALLLIGSQNGIAKALGIALLVLPIVGAWALVSEIVFVVRGQRLVRRLGEQGGLPVDDLPRLPSGRIDPQAETRKYVDKIVAARSATLTEDEKALLIEDLRSPCTEEVAVFHAFSHVVSQARSAFVVMDTAPTGHSLLLMDATGAYHRDIVRQMADSHAHFVTPMMRLQDPKQTKVLIVTLAETTPVLEAANLQADLQRAGITPWAWVINNSVAASALRTPLTSPLLRQRARNERVEIAAVAQRHASRYALVPLLKDEPIGVARLMQLMRDAAAPAELANEN